MKRRAAVAWMGGMGVSMMASAADNASSHDHAKMTGMPPPATTKYGALVAPYQECVRASQACISHCQQLLAQGDKSLGTCLRTALDTEVVCSSALKLVNLGSQFALAIVRQSVPVMQACVEACKEHIDHHAECKACHDACLKAIEAAKGAA